MSLLVVGFYQGRGDSFLSRARGSGRPGLVGHHAFEAQAELVLATGGSSRQPRFSWRSFVTAFSLLTDALRDALDPKLR